MFQLLPELDCTAKLAPESVEFVAKVKMSETDQLPPQLEHHAFTTGLAAFAKSGEV